jgi:hypothetical protein
LRLSKHIGVAWRTAHRILRLWKREANNKENVREFCRRHIKGGGRQIRTDALPALKATGEGHTHEKKITLPEEAGHGLPLVHIMTGNLKTFLNGTFHGVSHLSLQDYINEFCYRFNRRFWEGELLMHLLNVCLAHTPAL